MTTKAAEAASMDQKVMTAEDILGLNQVEYATIPELSLVPGHVIRIQSLSAEDFMEWTEMREADKIGKRNAGLKLIIKSVVNPEGQQIFNDTHLASLAKVRHKVTEAVLKEILNLNGMTSKVEKNAKND